MDVKEELVRVLVSELGRYSFEWTSPEGVADTILARFDLTLKAPE